MVKYELRVHVRDVIFGLDVGNHTGYDLITIHEDGSSTIQYIDLYTNFSLDMGFYISAPVPAQEYTITDADGNSRTILWGTQTAHDGAMQATTVEYLTEYKVYTSTIIDATNSTEAFKIFNKIKLEATILDQLKDELSYNAKSRNCNTSTNYFAQQYLSGQNVFAGLPYGIYMGYSDPFYDPDSTDTTDVTIKTVRNILDKYNTLVSGNIDLDNIKYGVVKQSDGWYVRFSSDEYKYVFAGAGSAYIVDIAGDSVIYADTGSHTIYAGDGNDLVEGGQFVDTVYSGSGFNNIYTYGDDDIVYTNDGMASDYNEVYLGAGSDKFFGGDGYDNIDGGAGNDYIEGGTGNDNILAGTGYDIIDPGTGVNDVDCGEDNVKDVVCINTDEAGIDTLRNIDSHDEVWCYGGFDLGSIVMSPNDIIIYGNYKNKIIFENVGTPGAGWDVNYNMPDLVQPDGTIWEWGEKGYRDSGRKGTAYGTSSNSSSSLSSQNASDLLTQALSTFGADSGSRTDISEAGGTVSEMYDLACGYDLTKKAV